MIYGIDSGAAVRKFLPDWSFPMFFRLIRGRSFQTQHPKGCISRPGPNGPRARQDWVHEHAETGKPFAADEQHGARSDDGADRLRFQNALRTCRPPTAERPRLMSIIWLAWGWLLRSGAVASRGAQERVATNSLLSDHRFRTLARLGSRCGSPPSSAAGHSRVPATPAKHWSSTPHIPKLPFRTRLHQSLPHAPAGESRWAERYDGKGNLHIQHAA